MKKTITTLCFLIYIVNLYAQPQFNNFENSENLDIEIGSMSSDSIWQIGIPEKVLFNEAFSPPNALITDTIENYPTNLNASFIVELSSTTMFSFPFVQLEWFQKTDMEEDIDGGVIEASYDEGVTWTNIFDDPDFRPEIVGVFQWDTLHNGQAGITGTTSDWEWMAICWGTIVGTMPDDISSVQVRFTMTSDSIDTSQEGWMFDNFNVGIGFIGNTSNEGRIRPFPLFPNPAKREIKLDLSNIMTRDKNILIYNNLGVLVHNETISTNSELIHTISINNYQTGVYFVNIIADESVYQQKFIKIE